MQLSVIPTVPTDIFQSSNLLHSFLVTTLCNLLFARCIWCTGSHGPTGAQCTHHVYSMLKSNALTTTSPKLCGFIFLRFLCSGKGVGIGHVGIRRSVFNVRSAWDQQKCRYGEYTNHIISKKSMEEYCVGNSPELVP